METNTLALIVILVLAVTGFVFLAWTLMAARKSLSEGEGSLFGGKVNGRPISEPMTPEDCYDECMKKSGWASSQARPCSIKCNL
jgi:hypothetical protein